MAAGWRVWLSAWDDNITEADEYRELDAKRALVIGRMRGRGKTSGLPVETEFANKFEIRPAKSCGCDCTRTAPVRSPISA